MRGVGQRQRGAASGLFSGCRFGLSLLELLAVIILMGILSVAVGGRYGRNIFGDTGVRSHARQLTAGLTTAQRSAIRTGRPHAVRFDGSLSQVASWSIVRYDPLEGTVLVDGPHDLPDEVRLSVDRTEIVFDFVGHGATPLTALFAGPNRTWMVSVEPMTRMIDCQEVR